MDSSNPSPASPPLTSRTSLASFPSPTSSTSSFENDTTKLLCKNNSHSNPITWIRMRSEFDKEVMSEDDGNNRLARQLSPSSDSSSTLLNTLPQSSSIEPTFKTYKRRWFGLLQLILLNIVVSWDWLTFAAVSSTSAAYFNVSVSAINWLSTGFLFAFCVAAPFTIIALHKGPKASIMTASLLILGGNWVRYAGAKLALFEVVITGQVLIGLSQPFVLAAPTRYSDLWFTDSGRVTATAIASLANPFGGALGQLFAPIWVPSSQPNQIPRMVLYVSIISSIASIPSFFIPAEPPTPPSASGRVEKTPLRQSLQRLAKNGRFYLILIPFAIYVGFFNALSSLIAQVLTPFGFTENQSGIAGAVLIVVGIISSIIISIITDRTHAYSFIIKLTTPFVAISYLAFLFSPPTRNILAPDIILGFLGAASFGLMPVALEYVVETTYPVSPEVTSTILWTSGQLLGGIFIIIMNALKDNDGSTTNKSFFPPGNMQKALIFQAVVCSLTVIFPFGLNLRLLGLDGDERKRYAVDLEESRPVQI